MMPSYEDLQAENAWLKAQIKDLTGVALTPILRAKLGISPQQANVLAVLTRAPDRLVTRNTLYETVFQHDDGDGPGMKIIDVVMCKIRAAMARSGIPGSIENIWGVGYRADADLCAWVHQQVPA